MASSFDRAWRKAEVALDAAFAEPLELHPMGRSAGDVNAPLGPDTSRSVLTSLVGEFVIERAAAALGEGGRGASAAAGGMMQVGSRVSVAIRKALLPYAVRDGDVVVRPADVDGTTVLRPAETYRVAAPGVVDGDGRVVLPLTFSTARDVP